MNFTYYLKIFIAFILFGILLIGFSLYVSTSFFQTHYEKITANNAKKIIKIKSENFKEFIETYDKKILAISSSEAFKSFSSAKTKVKLVDLFKTTINANKNLLEIKVLNLEGQELLRVDKNDSDAFVVQKLFLENRSKESYFFSLINYASNKVWHSDFELNMQKGELVYPIQPVIHFAVKLDSYIVMMVLDSQKIFNMFLTSNDLGFNIFTSNGDYILHKNQNYNWSKYFYPNINLKRDFEAHYKNILESEMIQNQSFISKKISIDQSKYIIMLVEFAQSPWVNTFQKYGNSIYIIVALTMLLSIFLAVLFSNPLAKLNKKLEEERNDLNLSVLESSEKLDDSLALIDKYVMYIKVDKNRRIVDVSASFCYTSGFAKEELLGEDYTKLLHPDYDVNRFFVIWKSIQGGKKWHGEMKNHKKFGGHYWVESFFEPNMGDNGNFLGFTEIRNNITDKKIIQNLYDDINYQIEQLSAVFQSADSGIALLSIQGNFKKVNTAFCNLLGYSTKALLKQNILQLSLKSRRNFMEKIFKEVKEFGSISNIETIFLCKDNNEVNVNVSLRMLPDKTHIVLVANSLEDKRKLQELNANLEQKVYDEVQKNIEKDRIHQEQQIKNAKLTSIGALAAGITHEINTPLTYLKGNFEMMQYDIDALPESDEKHNMKEDSAKIHEAINRIANIVESMREMSQSSSEAKENINLYSTIITSLTMAYNMSKQVSPIYLNGKLFSINNLEKNEYEFIRCVQKQRIEQVWVIIVNNAIDELRKVDNYDDRALNIDIFEEKSNVVVRFKDNAGGIDDEILDDIFEPFVSSKEHGGMGVGLNIAKKIIDEQEGEIVAYNENDGAVFEVRLPL